MSAPLAEPQATLPGLPPAPAQTPAHPATAAAHCEHGEPLKLCIRGHLAAAARLIDDPQHRGRALLEVQLHQHVPRHPRALPLVAVWAYPDRLGSALAYERALALALRLPEGEEVLVLGRGLETSHHRGEPCLRVLDVMGIRPADEAAEPSPQGSLC